MAFDPQIMALRPEQDVNQLSVTGLQPAQRALTSLQAQPQQAFERQAMAFPEIRPMPQGQPALEPERAISSPQVFEDRSRTEALMRQRAEMTKPISWEHDLDVQKIRAESPEAFRQYKDLMIEHDVVDQNGVTTPVKMQEFMAKASSDPELFKRVASPKISIADMKYETARKKYESMKEKTHPDDMVGMGKLKEAEALNNSAKQERANILYEYVQALGQVEETGKKMKTRQSIGQFMVDNEQFIRNLPPMEQKLMQQLFMTGDIEGFANFLGDHPDLTTAYNARGQR